MMCRIFHGLDPLQKYTDTMQVPDVYRAKVAMLEAALPQEAMTNAVIPGIGIAWRYSYCIDFFLDTDDCAYTINPSKAQQATVKSFINEWRKNEGTGE